MSRVPSSVRRRFWAESVLSAVTGFLFLLTIVGPEWLEAFGWDPDHGNGTVEWAIVAGLLAVCVVTAASARVEWRRAAVAGA